VEDDDEYGYEYDDDESRSDSCDSHDDHDDEEDVTGRFDYHRQRQRPFSVSSDGRPLCSESHVMEFSNNAEGDYSYGWVCNFCEKHGEGVRWVCAVCSDDYCAKCACKYGPLKRHDTYYGDLSYSECVDYAKSKGSDLPSVAQVLQEIARHGGVPLFPHEDMWWPVSDAPDTWISVGSYDHEVRLGKTHNELFGIPEWSQSSRNISEREVIAIVRPEKDRDSDDDDDDDDEDGEHHEAEGDVDGSDGDEDHSKADGEDNDDVQGSDEGRDDDNDGDDGSEEKDSDDDER
jgi:hypothetical protein